MQRSERDDEQLDTGSTAVTRRTVLRGSGVVGTGAVLPGLLSQTSGATSQSGSTDDFTFISCPDMFNWDIPNPQPGYEDALDWFFAQITSEDPEFVLNAGDVMDARWWKNEDQVRRLCHEYWTGFKDRFDEHGLPLYVAPGDHDRGDNPIKRRLVPAFEESFVDIYDHPMNGPPNKKGLAYYFTRGDVLFVTVDVYEYYGGENHWSVTGEQLTWLEQVLAAHQDKEFIVVQGHTPAIGPVKSRDSSGLMLEGGRSSPFWQAMKQYDVDVVLNGEHHAITTKKVDGIWQIVHGALWGTHENLNYLVGTVRDGRLILELKEYYTNNLGGMLQTKSHELGNRPYVGPSKNVEITEQSKANGPTTLQRIVIDSCGCPGKNWSQRTVTPDESGKNNDGILHGNVSQVPGKTGSGLEFTGGYVSVPESPSVDITQAPITAECWVKPADPASGGEGYQPYVTKTGSAGGQYSLHRVPLTHPGNGQLEFAIQTPGGDWGWARAPVPDDWQGTWHHLAAVYDGTLIELYVDGESVDETAFSGTLSDANTPVGIGRNSGKHERTVSHGTVIDRVRIYRQALSANELAAEKRSPVDTSDAVLWLDFETVETQGLDLDASIAESGLLTPGEMAEVTTTLTNDTDSALQDVAFTIDPPAGWTATANSSPTVGRVGPDRVASVTWTVTVPSSTRPGEYLLFLEASFTTGDGGTCCLSSNVSTEVTDGDAGPSPIGNRQRPPTDPDGDGEYEDLTGDGEITYEDVRAYAEHVDDPGLQEQVDAFDYNDNGRIDHADLVELFDELQSN